MPTPRVPPDAKNVYQSVRKARIDKGRFYTAVTRNTDALYIQGQIGMVAVDVAFVNEKRNVTFEDNRSTDREYKCT